MDSGYFSVNEFFRKKFHHRVDKIPLDAGFGCPNKDGTRSLRGCIFCDEYGSGPLRTGHLPLREQIQRFMDRYPDRKFAAYYQAHTNTYGPVAELKEKYEIIFDYPRIVALFIGTRPDAIAEEVYPLLEGLRRRIYLSVELGLQSVHERSLAFLNRNHTYSTFLNTHRRLTDLGIDVVVHLIVGIPGESRQDLMETVGEINRLRPAGVKLHLMHILKNTDLFERYRKAPFALLGKDEYEDLIIQVLENLDPGIVIHRLTGERDPEIFYRPRWALNKNAVIQSIRRKMEQRKTRQGIRYAESLKK